MNKVAFMRWLIKHEQLKFNTEKFFRDSKFVFMDQEFSLENEANMVLAQIGFIRTIKEAVLNGEFDDKEY